MLSFYFIRKADSKNFNTISMDDHLREVFGAEKANDSDGWYMNWACMFSDRLFKDGVQMWPPNMRNMLTYLNENFKVYTTVTPLW